MKYLLKSGKKIFQNICGFEYRQSWNFKVSRLNKRQDRFFFSKAQKSLFLHKLTNFFLLNFITQCYLKINRDSKLIDFFVKYPNVNVLRPTLSKAAGETIIFSSIARYGYHIKVMYHALWFWLLLYHLSWKKHLSLFTFCYIFCFLKLLLLLIYRHLQPTENTRFLAVRNVWTISIQIQSILQNIQGDYSKSKQPSTNISYIIKSGLTRDANSKEKTDFWLKVFW